jgi:YHS domain-containing protein
MKFLLFTVILLLVNFSYTQTPTPPEHQNLDNQVALQGYDPVSYFKSEPTEGKQDISFSHNGVIYYFSSEENKKTFKENPTKYEPQYGGYCAYAIGDNGEKVSIDPETYKIIDGKLYLFYNQFFTNTLKSWNKNEDELKLKADQNWANILKNEN